jgi:O-glycosyl hydrolase
LATAGGRPRHEVAPTHRPRADWLAVSLLLALAGPALAATVTVDGAQTYQVIDGFGVNANHRNWTNNELKPVLDALVDQAGLTLFRVVYDNTDWEQTSVYNSNPTNINWTYYNSVYSSPDFEALWGMAGYLNQRGITNGLMFNFQGAGPAWMADTMLFSGYEDEWAEMIASLVIYARNNRHLQFHLVAPDNEPDNLTDPRLQGIYMDTDQYITALDNLAARLDANGLSDVRLVGPDLAYTSLDWLAAMTNDPVLMAKLASFGFHSYQNSGGGSDGVYGFLQSSPYPDHPFWMTEFNVWCDVCESCSGGTNSWDYAFNMVQYLLAHLANGASAGLVWEGYDSFYNILNCWSYWGLFAVNDINATPKTYSPRKQFYALAQISKFVRPGAQCIDASGATDPLVLLAFYHTNYAQITLTGVNTDSQAAVLFGTLTNLPAATNLDLYYTSPDTNLAWAGSFPVANGAFTATIPANCIFTLRANLAVGPLAQVTITPPQPVVLSYQNLQFTALGTDSLGALLHPQPAFTWQTTGGGILHPDGLFRVGGALGGPFTVTATSGGITGAAPLTISGNMALGGSAFSWFNLTSSTDNSPQAPAPGLNDGDLNSNIPLLAGGGNDNPNAYEAAGVLWPNPQTFSRIVYHNGSFTATGDGVFDADFGLQFSPDGLSWSDAGPEWLLTPAYSYNSADSAGVAFAFAGGLATAQGVRCVGQVHTQPIAANSWFALATEIEAFGPPWPSPLLTATSSSNRLALSWPAALSNYYALESSTALPPGAYWTPVTNPSQVLGAQQTVTLPLAAAAQFFRLHLQ